MKRLFDIIASVLALFFLWPVLLLIALSIIIETRGGVIFKQQRVGRGEQVFWIYKFRTMRPDSESKGLLTVGGRDTRITKVGYYLRKYKLDEMTQLLNILKGDMSWVGPRPEVLKYVNMYNEEQKKVLSVKPGLTDYASLAYINENEILQKSPHPEQTYIQEIMPAKLQMNLRYIKEKSLLTDLKIMWKTFLKILS
ncbi:MULTISPECIES: sugar transferase [unclassified Lentimicrobium]|uniref:sugar transferase n=1 Tax=unclassified Lentimicrobium TaxID=2677434 RepID=UPI001552F4CB|nr:sugar transferase [Lentimicrobium sp. S6]NPD85294.1 sugar transferase [Lentimicrobium sp. L6]